MVTARESLQSGQRVRVYSANVYRFHTGIIMISSQLSSDTPGGAQEERYGNLVRDWRQQGTPIPTNDLWIAATALETGTRLVSYDAHFQHVPGLIVIAP